MNWKGRGRKRVSTVIRHCPKMFSATGEPGMGASFWLKLLNIRIIKRIFGQVCVVANCAISLRHVRPSVRMHQRRSHVTDFREIW
jgi:hypothetical protein